MAQRFGSETGKFIFLWPSRLEIKWEVKSHVWNSCWKSLANYSQAKEVLNYMLEVVISFSVK